MGRFDGADSGSGSSSSGGGRFDGATAKKEKKKKPPARHGSGGFLGLGVGPSITDLVAEGERSIEGVAEGFAGAGGQIGHTFNKLGSGIGHGLTAIVNGDDRYYDLAYKDLMEGTDSLGGMVVGASSSMANTTGDFLDLTTGGLAGDPYRALQDKALGTLANLASGGKHPEQAKQVGKDLGPEDFQTRADRSGYLSPVIEDIGNVAILGRAGVKAGGFLSETAAEGSTLARVGARTAKISEPLAHPIRGVYENVARPFTRAGQATRLSTINLPDEVRPEVEFMDPENPLSGRVSAESAAARQAAAQETIARQRAIQASQAVDPGVDPNALPAHSAAEPRVVEQSVSAVKEAAEQARREASVAAAAEISPRLQRTQRILDKPIPERIQKLTDKLGPDSKIVGALTRLEGASMNRAARVSARELARNALELTRNKTFHGKGTQSAIKAARLLVKKEGLTAAEADAIIGAEIEGRMSGKAQVIGAEVERQPALAEAAAKAADNGLVIDEPLYQAHPELRTLVEQAVKEHTAAVRELPAMQAKTRIGDKGFKDIAAQNPEMNRAQVRLMQRIEGLRGKATRRRGRVGKELESLQKRLDNLTAAAERTGGRIEAQEAIKEAAQAKFKELRKASGEPEPKAATGKSVRPATKAVATRTAKGAVAKGKRAFTYTKDVVTDATRDKFNKMTNQERRGMFNEEMDQIWDPDLYAADFPDPNDARRGGFRDVTTKELADMGYDMRDVLRQQLIHNADEAEARGVTWNPSTRKFTPNEPEFQGVADRLNIAKVPEPVAGPPKPLSPKQLVRMTKAEPNATAATTKAALKAAQERLRQIPRRIPAKATSVQASRWTREAAELRAQIAEHRAALKKIELKENPNAALQRGANLAYTADEIIGAVKEIDRLKKLKSGTLSSAEKLQAQIDAGDTTSARAANKAEQVAKVAEARLMDQLENAPWQQWPRAYQPLGRVLQEIKDEAIASKNPDMLEAVNDPDFPSTFSKVVKRGKELGADFEHVRDFSEGEVSALMDSVIRLGKKGRVGLEEVSGARKTYTGARASAGGSERTIKALAASIVEAHHEIVSNQYTDALEQMFAHPIKKGETVPKGFVPWDGAKQFLATGKDDMGNITAAGGTTKVIPEAVWRALKRQGQDFQHGAFGMFQKVTNPWRALILTMSPRWYVNNAVGNLILATKEGVALQDWKKALTSFRQKDELGRFADVPAVQGRSMVNDLDDMGSIVPTKGLKEAWGSQENVFRKVGAVRRQVGHGLRQANEVVDEFARTAVYHKTLRTTGDLNKAADRAMSALVDYGNLSPFEQQIVKQVVPFYSWQKNLLQIVAKMPVDNPISMSIIMRLGEMNRQRMEEEYGELPSGYAALVGVGSGAVNTRGLNPFVDALSLTTPDGIQSAVNPFASVLIRKALGAPEGGFVTGRRVNPYGVAVPDTDLDEELAGIAEGVPLSQLGAAGLGTGDSTDSGAQQIGRFFGFNWKSEDQIKEVAKRTKKAKEQVKANAPFPARDKKPEGSSSSSSSGGRFDR